MPKAPHEVIADEDEDEDSSLSDQIREEHLRHVTRCSFVPQVDTKQKRAREDSAGTINACEHVAASIAARNYFVWDIARDVDAIQEYRIACGPCASSARANGSAPGKRWLVCSRCCDEYQIAHGWPALHHIAPRCRESFNPWWARVADALSNVPKDVAHQWIHRHWGGSPYERMPILQMGFTLETWPLARVLGVGAGPRDYPRGDHIGSIPREFDDRWLARRMQRNRTWPRPIIVLDNDPPSDSALHALQLLEGHTRLSFLRTLATKDIALSVHDVWLARIPR